MAPRSQFERDSPFPGSGSGYRWQVCALELRGGRATGPAFPRRIGVDPEASGDSRTLPETGHPGPGIDHAPAGLDFFPFGKGGDGSQTGLASFFGKDGTADWILYHEAVSSVAVSMGSPASDCSDRSDAELLDFSHNFFFKSSSNVFSHSPIIQIRPSCRPSRP